MMKRQIFDRDLCQPSMNNRGRMIPSPIRIVSDGKNAVDTLQK